MAIVESSLHKSSIQELSATMNTNVAYIHPCQLIPSIATRWMDG